MKSWQFGRATLVGQLFLVLLPWPLCGKGISPEAKLCPLSHSCLLLSILHHSDKLLKFQLFCILLQFLRISQLSLKSWDFLAFLLPFSVFLCVFIFFIIFYIFSPAPLSCFFQIPLNFWSFLFFLYSFLMLIFSTTSTFPAFLDSLLTFCQL